MDSKEFWDMAKDYRLSFRFYENSESVSAEELYQHFADRFRRENYANYRHYVQGEYGFFKGEQCPIVEKTE